MAIDSSLAQPGHQHELPGMAEKRMNSTKRAARIAGLLYLLVSIPGAFGLISDPERAPESPPVRGGRAIALKDRRAKNPLDITTTNVITSLHT